ncbi:hypothetical protein L218DRAFT_538146 [Marasmius fiardii PR-910]|nr:hypothetical protein L218DRAFT_538146 [Marasmius fiardii PR-910]
MVCGTADAANSYLHDFQEHVSAFQRHLSGEGEEQLSSSFIQPSGYWTPSEKELFFHSLSIHTRFRPDLIALEVKSKTTADVCSYLAVLEQASAQSQSVRNGLDIAVTVPDSWVEMEDRESSKLKVSLERIGEDGEDLDRRLAFLDSHKLCVIDHILQERDSEDSTAKNLDVETHTHTSSSLYCPWVDPETSEQLPSTAESRATTEIDSKRPLSPASRKRLAKRLYMRRKRAKLSGTTADLHADKLQPGRKAKVVRGKVSTPRDEENVRDEYSLDVTQNNDISNNTGPSVNEQEQTIKDEENSLDLEREAWKESGVDADVLLSRNLGLFHLSTLCDLMRLYKLTSYEGLSPTVTSCVSGTTIQTLDCIVKSFVSEVIYHCIVLREEERRFKGQTKVWRLGTVHDEISFNTVNHALAIMGQSRTCKATGSTELLAPKGNVEAEGERFNASDTSANELTQQSQLARNEFEPFFWRIPKNLSESDELMPSETDEEALRLELEEDLGMDEFDRTLETEYQQRFEDIRTLTKATT